MKQHLKTPITDEYLTSLTGMTAAEPKDFFYSRLINRIENEQQLAAWKFPLKPVWMITTLIILLLMNTFILIQKGDSASAPSPATIQGFADAYDQHISSY